MASGISNGAAGRQASRNNLYPAEKIYRRRGCARAHASKPVYDPRFSFDAYFIEAAPRRGSPRCARTLNAPPSPPPRPSRHTRLFAFPSFLDSRSIVSIPLLLPLRRFSSRSRSSPAFDRQISPPPPSSYMRLLIISGMLAPPWVRARRGIDRAARRDCFECPGLFLFAELRERRRERDLAALA